MHGRSGFLIVAQFAVGFENVGQTSVYFESYELNTSIAANSSVDRETCNCGLGVSSMVDLAPGRSYTLYDPSSGDGYFYALLRGGTLNATFSFEWTVGSAACATPNTTTVSAQFTFSSPPEP